MRVAWLKAHVRRPSPSSQPPARTMCRRPASASPTRAPMRHGSAGRPARPGGCRRTRSSFSPPARASPMKPWAMRPEVPIAPTAGSRPIVGRHRAARAAMGFRSRSDSSARTSSVSPISGATSGNGPRPASTASISTGRVRIWMTRRPAAFRWSPGSTGRRWSTSCATPRAAAVPSERRRITWGSASSRILRGMSLYLDPCGRPT